MDPLRKKSTILLFLALSIINQIPVYSQEVPHPVKNTGVYEFLDELAGMQIVEINSAVKPYSRLFIANRLKEADNRRDQLNTRQQKELDFYLMDFRKELKETTFAEASVVEGRNDSTAQRSNGSTAQGRNGAMAGPQDRRTAEQQNSMTLLWNKGLEVKNSNEKTTHLRRDLFYYKDSLFSLTANVILGGELFTNSSGKATYFRNGAEIRGYIKNLGFYASLRDNHEEPLLGLPEYLTKREGGHVKGSTDWSEMQGGITWAWKWGNIGLVKDRQQWGNNYNGANIFGGNNPTFAQLKLNLKPARWFEFNYFNGWLNSMVVDSSESYWVTNSYGNDYREVYHKKFVAANIFTITPVKNLNISAGNSIVYDNDHINPAYIIPFLFYKSVDHSQTSGIDNMNSQMFFDISSRNIKNLHLYVSLFVDELSTSKLTEDDEWNFVSWKTGFRLSNTPIQNLSFTTEFTYSYPLTYQHYVPTVTFQTQDYNLGHYLRDNSREWYFALDYKPIRALNIGLYFADAIRGPDYTELGTDRVGNPPLASVEWQSTVIGMKAYYQIINDLLAWCNFFNSNVNGDERWSPDYFYGRKNTFNLGITFGF
jgi:hypothetical protein